MRQVTLLARCSKQCKIIERVVAFADEGWSFTRGSNYRKSARASRTPHYTLNEERSARFIRPEGVLFAPAIQRTSEEERLIAG